MRVVYGATCTWWDTEDRMSTIEPAGLPCCPSCGGVLYEVESEAAWWAGIDATDHDNPGYRAFNEWLRGRCFRFRDEARAVFAIEKARANFVRAAVDATWESYATLTAALTALQVGDGEEVANILAGLTDRDTLRTTFLALSLLHRVLVMEAEREQVPVEELLQRMGITVAAERSGL